jgi:hypothetical protein
MRPPERSIVRRPRPDDRVRNRPAVSLGLLVEVEQEAAELGEASRLLIRSRALEGRTIIVTYNADHPAYQRLILDNRDNRGQIAAMDFLVWTLVAAELRNVDDDHARFAERMREDASFNLASCSRSEAGGMWVGLGAPPSRLALDCLGNRAERRLCGRHRLPRVPVHRPSA